MAPRCRGPHWHIDALALPYENTGGRHALAAGSVTVAWLLLMLLKNVWYATAFVRLIPNAVVFAV
jgi:hypothetical protein